jgi:hypothetical protein
MADMFGRSTVLGGVMSAEATRLDFTNIGIENKGLIVRQMTLSYSQNLTRLYALEDASVYFVAGRTEGQFQFQHVIGPQGLQQKFLEAYGNICKIGQAVFNLSMQTGCDTTSSGKATVQLSHPVITSITLQAEAGNMVITSGLQGLFVAMTITSVGGGGFNDLGMVTA